MFCPLSVFDESKFRLGYKEAAVFGYTDTAQGLALVNTDTIEIDAEGVGLAYGVAVSVPVGGGYATITFELTTRAFVASDDVLRFKPGDIEVALQHLAPGPTRDLLLRVAADEINPAPVGECSISDVHLIESLSAAKVAPHTVVRVAAAWGRQGEKHPVRHGTAIMWWGGFVLRMTDGGLLYLQSWLRSDHPLTVDDPVIQRQTATAKLPPSMLDGIFDDDQLQRALGNLEPATWMDSPPELNSALRSTT